MGGNHNTDLVGDCISSLNSLFTASGNLTYVLENVTLLAKRLEQKANELGTQENQLSRLSDILSSKRQELEVVEMKLNEREEEMKARENRIVEIGLTRSEVEKKMALNAEKWANKIQMNVGMLYT